jgi:hypothetical protein
MAGRAPHLLLRKVYQWGRDSGNMTEREQFFPSARSSTSIANELLQVST